MSNIENLLLSYPRSRPSLPAAHQEIYEQEYKNNRSGGTLASRWAQRAERWMHYKIAQRAAESQSVLEIGAGTLNHVPYEKAPVYDVVEPFRSLYADSPYRKRIRNIFADVSEIPGDMRYERIVSIAVLEHLERLPEVVAQSAMLLSKGGMFQHSIPSEGGMLWGLGWRMTTGLAYRIRNGLSYGTLMSHEHINEAPEIIDITKWFFQEVKIKRFPLPLHHASLYTYVEAQNPYQDRCTSYLLRSRQT
jgi:hypothetical protein